MKYRIVDKTTLREGEGGLPYWSVKNENGGEDQLALLTLDSFHFPPGTIVWIEEPATKKTDKWWDDYWQSMNDLREENKQ